MAAGRVTVNGRVVTELGTRVDPARDRVEVDGRAVRAERPRWILLHKPAGTLTTRRDPGGRRTVYDLLPEDARGLRYVGRLDRDSEGLLLFTNQGDVANRLQHPSGEVEREYHAGLEGFPDGATLRRLTAGVTLEDGPARAASARVLRQESGGVVLALVLREGRKREVRRLLAAVGHPVRWLKRVRFGPQRLGELPLGAWRALSPDEVARLEEAAGGGRRRGVRGRPEGQGRKKPRG
jgi:23S rRNA pseudouridine2605 synthase